MKKLLLTLAVAAAAIASSAQIIQGPNNYPALTNGAPVFQASGGVTTNLPTSQTRVVPLGGNGFSFTFRGNGTNAVVTTNLTFRFQIRGDSSNWSTAFFPTFIHAPNGTTEVVGTTNMPVDMFRNASAVRLYSIQNTNYNGGTASNLDFWLTNMIFTVR